MASISAIRALACASALAESLEEVRMASAESPNRPTAINPKSTNNKSVEINAKPRNFCLQRRGDPLIAGFENFDIRAAIISESNEWSWYLQRSEPLRKNFFRIIL
jgi:hypothetical protein